MIVADAALVAGLIFSADDFHPVALRVRQQDPDWHSPELLFSEVRNVGLKQLRKPGNTLDALIARCNLVAGQVSVYRLHSHGVLHAATEGGLTAYDAEYVALARQLSAVLVTTDELVLRKFPALAKSPEQFLKS